MTEGVKYSSWKDMGDIATALYLGKGECTNRNWGWLPCYSLTCICSYIGFQNVQEILVEQGVHNLARVNLVLYGLLLMAMNLPFGSGPSGVFIFCPLCFSHLCRSQAKNCLSRFSSPRIIMTQSKTSNIIKPSL